MPTETAKIAKIQSRHRQTQSNLHAAIAPGVATAISKQAIGNSESPRERRDRRASQSRPRSKKQSPPTARRRGAPRSGAARQGEGGETAGGFEGRAGAGRGSGSRAKRGRGVERNWGKARRGREGQWSKTGGGGGGVFRSKPGPPGCGSLGHFPICHPWSWAFWVPNLCWVTPCQVSKFSWFSISAQTNILLSFFKIKRNRSLVGLSILNF